MVKAPAGVQSSGERDHPPIDGAVERRVRRQFAEQQMTAARDSRTPKATDSWGERFGFGIVSLVLAVPLSAIGGGIAHLPGLIAAWVGIVGVNAVQAARTNPGLFSGRGRSSGKDGGDWED
ncbi:hypothetical protein ACFW88_05380 [Streptomyces anandii]|uniref:DUF3040 domain-containing protein n=1 Tax=Streptomyces anandii TaxID=285454 RepID=A0ABW6H048_9ACTN